MAEQSEKMKVLNVGGNNKSIPLPPYFKDFEHLLLDIDPRGKPDVVADARELDKLEAKQFDAIYCSHNLEHYYRHDVMKVLKGFHHVLKDQGFAVRFIVSNAPGLGRPETAIVVRAGRRLPIFST